MPSHTCTPPPESKWVYLMPMLKCKTSMSIAGSWSDNSDFVSEKEGGDQELFLESLCQLLVITMPFKCTWTILDHPVWDQCGTPQNGKGSSKSTQMKREMGESRKRFLELSPNSSRDVRRKGSQGPGFSGGPSLPATWLFLSVLLQVRPHFFQKEKHLHWKGSIDSQAGVFGTWEEQQRGNSSEVDLGKVKKVKLIFKGVVCSSSHGSCV